MRETAQRSTAPGPVHADQDQQVVSRLPEMPPLSDRHPDRGRYHGRIWHRRVGAHLPPSVRWHSAGLPRGSDRDPRLAAPRRGWIVRTPPGGV